MIITPDKLIDYASVIQSYCEDRDDCDGCPFYREYNYGGIKHCGCALNGTSPIDWDETMVTR